MRLNLVLQENGGDANTSAAERLAIELQRQADFVNAWTTEHQLKLPTEAGVTQLQEIGTVRKGLADKVRIRVQDRFLVPIGNRSVVDDRRVGNDGV